MIKQMEKVTDGLCFKDPVMGASFQCIMDGFVDDITSWAGLPDTVADGEEVDALVEKLQTTTQWWKQLLNASGGKLELEKRFYYILHWGADPEGKPRLNSFEDTRRVLAITSSETGKEIRINQ